MYTGKKLFFVSLLLYFYGQALANKNSTADHSQFEVLHQQFSTGPEVTKACLSCHTEASKQLHKTSHWNWTFENKLTGQKLGKKNVINNFCVATATNWPLCTSCHIGYGWKDDSFNHDSEVNVDCLVCHDTTGTYKKFPTSSGHPNYEPKEWPPNTGIIRQPPDFNRIAQSVGEPGRQNCGICHFYGGGGDGVKHGDLDSSMIYPSEELDVHMDYDGLNFNCQTCHTTGGHEVTGSHYATKASDKRGIVIPGQDDQNRGTCTSCHGDSPHPENSNQKLNDHTSLLACVTCHIPEYARGGRKTKMWWDWSTAGKKTADGHPLIVKDYEGYINYDYKKGDFKWQENVEPEYYWFDGEIRYTLLGDKIDDTQVVPINQVKGSYDDPDSRIWPFKVMRGRQAYDTKNKILAIPHLFGEDEAALWDNFDWIKALKAGMMARDQEFSGEYGFVETEYFWPLTHMVAPADQALTCNDCHSQNGRLNDLSGVYIPGNSRHEWLDKLGWFMVIATAAGFVLHGLVRLLMWRKRR